MLVPDQRFYGAYNVCVLHCQRKLAELKTTSARVNAHDSARWMTCALGTRADEPRWEIDP